ncbi:DUF3857 domain-containing protein [Pedobacter sp.]
MIRKLLYFLLILPFSSFSQEFEFGKLTESDFNFDRTKIDSNANAIYLNEFGTTRFTFDSETGRMMLVHNYHARIKIYKKEGFEAANVIVPLYKSGSANDQAEYISKIRAVTFNLENDNPVESEMSEKTVFKEEKSKYLTLTKFTLPNLKEGSIIEYEYTIESPYLFNFKTWNFQADFPKLQSTYVAYIPANYRYNVSLRGFYKLTETKSEVNNGCLRVAGKDMDCSKLTYTMKNLPAFMEEDYMTAASNYKSAIYFELSEVFYLNGSNQKYTKSWSDIDYELKSNKDFGGQMKRKEVFKNILSSVISDSDSDLSKAKKIYEYIKKQAKWNNYYGKYSEIGVKDLIEKRSGNAADINLALIAALGAANFDVEAVILSTRENGTVNKLYPIISDFNYVVAKVNIDNESYLLDATDPFMPFGLLPLRCINDQGRVINLKKPSYWMDLKASKKSLTSYSLIGTISEDGKVKATLTNMAMGYDAANTRKEIKKYTSIDEYVEKLDERLSNIKIKNFKISNIDSVENALIEEYEVEINTGSSNGGNQAFNPFFINPLRRNPFKLKERNYPVDLGAAREERILIRIALPSGFSIKEHPKDYSLALPNQGGRYILQTGINENEFTLNQLFTLNKAIYTSEEYYYLKEFYNQIIQKQKTDVVIVKANK